jgi:hypothetical protein
MRIWGILGECGGDRVSPASVRLDLSPTLAYNVGTAVNSPSSVRFEPRVLERLTAFVAVHREMTLSSARAAGRRSGRVGGHRRGAVGPGVGPGAGGRRGAPVSAATGGKPDTPQLHVRPRVPPHEGVYLAAVMALEAAAAGHETGRHGGVFWLRPPDA